MLGISKNITIRPCLHRDRYLFFFCSRVFVSCRRFGRDPGRGGVPNSAEIKSLRALSLSVDEECGVSLSRRTAEDIFTRWVSVPVIPEMSKLDAGSGTFGAEAPALPSHACSQPGYSGHVFRIARRK